MQKALLLVDVQNDFFPTGALPTPEGDSIIDPINHLLKHFCAESCPVYATRDWHPEDHYSFKEQGGLWPPHCIRGTDGAAFHPAIHLPPDTIVISKAQSQEKDAYSGFQGTDLEERLKATDISELVVAGLATDVCVKHTVLDALSAGFEVAVVREAVSGVEAEPGNSRKALHEMETNGAKVVSLIQVIP